AVRLPKEVAFEPDTEVTIVRSGDVLTIYPARPSIAEMVAKLDALPKPATIEARDDEPLPERDGL
ncbi:MAG: AbrB/MazE/SpoVT family DNA-binding domain-containing protein, partial [Caulobacteraceae bacterium]|nr:AbrB/MazE/SpoVT family DNA-binding domain-containing protein [Caulobacteraceae bacterium]